jgi:hypothetical protein
MASSLPSLDGSAKQGRFLKYRLDLGQEITRQPLYPNPNISNE